MSGLPFKQRELAGIAKARRRASAFLVPGSSTWRSPFREDSTGLSAVDSVSAAGLQRAVDFDGSALATARHFRPFPGSADMVGYLAVRQTDLSVLGSYSRKTVALQPPPARFDFADSRRHVILKALITTASAFFSDQGTFFGASSASAPTCC